MLNFFFPVPPHQILVYDASGRDVAGTVGPLLEGDSLVVTCEVRGGKSTLLYQKIFNSLRNKKCKKLLACMMNTSLTWEKSNFSNGL